MKYVISTNGSVYLVEEATPSLALQSVELFIRNCTGPVGENYHPFSGGLSMMTIDCVVPSTQPDDRDRL